MVLLYNSELGIIISSEFFHGKKLQKKCYLLPSILILFFRNVWWEKYLGNLFLYSSLDCDSKITSPTLVQNPHNLRGLHLPINRSQKEV